jgi:CheY-like chemotaxis protein
LACPIVEDTSVLPLYSHPCTWVFIDDHTRFLRALEATLPPYQPHKMFDKPREALDFLKGCSPSKFLTPTSTYEDEELVMRLDLGQITSRLTDPNRYSEVSVVVCDYAMPGMNGLELLEQIPDRSIRRILLTGVADEQVAVEAFNAGTIDRFVKKGAGEALDELVRSIQDQDAERIGDQQSELAKAVMGRDAFVMDSTFRNFFQTLCGSRGVVEYYFSLIPRGFLMLDAAGKSFFLLIVSDTELDELRDELRAQGLDKGLIRRVEQRDVAALVFERPPNLAVDDLAADCYSLEELPAAQGWYYAVVEDPPVDIDFAARKSSVSAYASRA